MPYKTLDCEQCGSEFTGYHNAKYCSDKCRVEAVSVASECEWCGSTYTNRKDRESRYCSDQCHDEARRRRVVLSCSYCGEEFEVISSKSHRKYCSIQCRSRAFKKEVICTCEQCGSEYKVRPFRAKDSQYCSQKCQFLSVVKPNTKGPDHPLWKDGEKPYYGPNWEGARKLVRNRDCFRCRKCGMHEDHCDTELHVHHIVPIREFDEPEEANTPSNLVTVCPSCHGEVEGDVEAGRALL